VVGKGFWRTRLSGKMACRCRLGYWLGWWKGLDGGSMLGLDAEDGVGRLTFLGGRGTDWCG
jgi:hypothetical protein